MKGIPEHAEDGGYDGNEEYRLTFDIESILNLPCRMLLRNKHRVEIPECRFHESVRWHFCESRTSQLQTLSHVLHIAAQKTRAPRVETCDEGNTKGIRGHDLPHVEEDLPHFFPHLQQWM